MTKPHREDPVLVNARREAIVVVCMWLTALAWTVGYSATFGYHPQPDPPLIGGIPSWVLYGVFLPWTVCTFLSTILSMFLIRDADLGEDPEEQRSEHEAAREVGDA